MPAPRTIEAMSGFDHDGYAHLNRWVQHGGGVPCPADPARGHPRLPAPGPAARPARRPPGRLRRPHRAPDLGAARVGRRPLPRTRRARVGVGAATTAARRPDPGGGRPEEPDHPGASECTPAGWPTSTKRLHPLSAPPSSPAGARCHRRRLPQRGDPRSCLPGVRRRLSDPGDPFGGGDAAAHCAGGARVHRQGAAAARCSPTCSEGACSVLEREYLLLERRHGSPRPSDSTRDQPAGRPFNRDVRYRPTG